MAKKPRPMGYIFPKRIKDAIQGEHSSKTFYYGEATKEIKEKHLKEAKEKLEKQELFKELRDTYIPPDFCPTCSKSMKSEDKKAWRKRGICFDCVLRVETHLRVIGKYKEYEEQLTLRNYKAYIIDIREQALEFVTNLKDETNIVNHDGTFDTLKGDQQKVRDFMNLEIEDLDKKLNDVADIDMSKTVYEVIGIELISLAKELYTTQKESKEKNLAEMELEKDSK